MPYLLVLSLVFGVGRDSSDSETRVIPGFLEDLKAMCLLLAIVYAIYKNQYVDELVSLIFFFCNLGKLTDLRYEEIE